VKEKLKQLKKQLDSATGAENVLLNIVDMDFLLTVAMASEAPEDTLKHFDEAMTRAAMRNQAQKIGLDRVIRRLETATTYLSSISEKDMSREDLIRLSTAKRALSGEFDT